MFQANVCRKNFSVFVQISWTSEIVSYWHTVKVHGTCLHYVRACTVRPCVRASKQSGAQIEGLCGAEPEAPAIFRKGWDQLIWHLLPTSQVPTPDLWTICFGIFTSFWHKTQVSQFHFLFRPLFYLELKCLIPGDNHYKVANTVKETAL